MPKLILKPDIHDFDRAGLEAYLEEVRAKRMTAAIEYHANANAKISYEMEKVQKKYWAKVERLEKYILKLDEAWERVRVQLEDIDIMKQDLGILTDRIVDPNEETTDGIQ